VHLADRREALRALIDNLVDPKAVAKIRYLHHDRLVGEVRDTLAVDYILVRAGDRSFRWLEVVAGWDR
jgi:hypothetical protein